MTSGQLTAAEVRRRLKLKTLCEPEGEKPVVSGYAGDLLSWVMGRAPANCAWVTVMNNQNVLAVASLCDVGCVICAEGAEPEETVLEKARAQGINVYASPRPVFELCAALSRLRGFAAEKGEKA